MAKDDTSAGVGFLAQLTLPELVEIWVEPEIDRRMKEVEYFHTEIVDGALRLEGIQVMPMRGGFRDAPRSIEVLVEVRDHRQRRTRIGAWKEPKRSRDDRHAFQRAYDKAMAHAIIQLLPASVWRPWISAAAQMI